VVGGSGKILVTRSIIGIMIVCVTIANGELKMQFLTGDGRKFRLEFQRVTPTRPGGKPSTYRATIARVIEIDIETGEKSLVAETKAGCWHKEKLFTLEEGRRAALRKLTALVTEDMRKPMWGTYLNRGIKHG
jgi:hypothetical protein